jgi:DNA-binding NtrC family response regulator
MPRLLVVDDEQDILDFVERVFRREYHVEQARSVEEAIAILEQREIDVLITDERMPRRSGYELLDRAAVLRPGAVRVMLSGFADGESAPRADAHLIKPIDADALRDAVTAAIARRAGA